MSRDIDIDIYELEEFIQALKRFQDQTHDRLKSVETSWGRCDETWKGDAKEEFTRQFENTEKAVQRSLEAGDDAVDWLEKFHEILEDLRDYR